MVTLAFAIQNGNYNQSVNIRTDTNGRFSADWIPTITGNYLITGSYDPCQTTVVSLSVVPAGTQYVFSVASNSTVSSLSFNSTGQILSFQLSGQTKQVAAIDVSIAKSVLPTPASL